MALKSLMLFFISGSLLIHYNVLSGTTQTLDFKITSAHTEEPYGTYVRSVVKRDANAEPDLEKNLTIVANEDGRNVTYTREQIMEEIRQHIYPSSWMWLLICLNCIVFVVGLVGNILVCVAVYRNHTMRTVTNYFIVNLAVADFLVILFCLPPTVVWDVTTTWFFGLVMCKVVLYLQVSY